MKTKIAYVAASVVVLTVPVMMLTAPMAGCGSTPSASTGTSPGNEAGTTKTDSSTPPPATDGGTTPPPAIDSGAGTTLVPLTATDTGYVSPTNPIVGTTLPNTVGVTGAWYAYGDGWGTEGVGGATGVAGERGNCELIGGFPVADCSTITQPAPAAPQAEAGAPAGDAGTPHAPGDAGDDGTVAITDAAADVGTAPSDATAPSDTGAAATDTGAPPPPSEDAGGGYANGFPPTPSNSQTFCLSGTAAEVIPGDGGAADYSDIYGIGIGFDFNNVGGVKMPYNANAFKVIGIAFDVSSVGPFPPLRVEFPTVGTNGAGGGDSYIVQPTANSSVVVKFTDLASPYPPVPGTNIGYAAPTGDTIPPLNAEGGAAPSDLLSIQFHIPTSTTGTVTVNQLCISNLSAVVAAQ